MMRSHLLFFVVVIAVVRGQYGPSEGESETPAPAAPKRDQSIPPPPIAHPVAPPAPTPTEKPACGFADILFVLDSTGSVRTFYEEQKSYMISIVQSLDIKPDGQHVGIIKYSSHRRMKILTPLDEQNEKAIVVSKVQDLTFNGGITETGAAMKLTKEALEKRRKDRKTAVVVLTDGFTFDDVVAPAKDLHGLSDVTIFVGGLADPVLKSVLVDITGDEARVMLGEEGKQKLINALKC
uniref:VWFA domain-containing protein n=1 Tax=Steinernema glaseri TaxID=37863 RepID=A0A1I7ZAU3_9BILA